MNTRRLWGAAVVAAVVALSGCTPRFVNGIFVNERTGTAKFLYSKSTLGFYSQGLIECQVDGKGNVSSCDEKPVNYE